MLLGMGTENALITDIVFWIASGFTILAAIGVVHVTNVFMASLFLVASFLGVAVIFVLLRAEFLAVVQVLIYVGAISVLIIFAVLMTRDVERGSPTNNFRVPALFLVVLFSSLMVFSVAQTDWNIIDEVIGSGDAMVPLVVAGDSGLDFDGVIVMISGVYADTVPTIASLLLNDFVLAFEAASVLLLGAVIGALALVRDVRER